MGRLEFYQTKVWKQNRISFALSKNCICERCHRPIYVDGISDSSIPKEHRLKYIVHHKEYLNETNYQDESIAFRLE